MSAAAFPDRQDVRVLFAHAAYQLADRFALRDTGIAHVEVRSADALERHVRDCNVLVVSGLWRNELLDVAAALRFVQSISAGVNQYSQDAFRVKGVRLASAAGVNERAVAEHAMALMLGLTRHLHTGRDHQARRHWRGMISDIDQREDELAGKTLLIVGLGRIGSRLARLAKAFEMRVIGVRQRPEAGLGGADAVLGVDRLPDALVQADIVALTCPLTPATTGLIGREALARMKPSALLINVARGGVVDEGALIAALEAKQIAAAGLDVTAEEPLAVSSPLWGFENVLITPHTAGETRKYEDGVIDLLLENLARLQRGDGELVNQIV